MLNAAGRLSTALLFLSAVLATGCTDTAQPPVNLNDGRQHFTENRARTTAVCDGRPFVVNADRVSLRISGPCRQVEVAGDHNDVEVAVLPGAVVDITGAHNDVTWRQQGPGPLPLLSDRGRSNTFHPGAPR